MYAGPGPYPPYGMVARHKPKSGTLLAAGILNILAAVIGFGTVIGFVLLEGTFLFLPLGELLLVCGAVGITTSCLAVVGGYLCVTRRKYGLCILGSVMAMISGSAGAGMVLGLIALVLVIMGKDDFLDQPPKPQWVPPPMVALVPPPVFSPVGAGDLRRFCSKCGTPVPPGGPCPACGTAF